MFSAASSNTGNITNSKSRIIEILSSCDFARKLFTDIARETSSNSMSLAASDPAASTFFRRIEIFFGDVSLSRIKSSVVWTDSRTDHVSSGDRNRTECSGRRQQTPQRPRLLRAKRTDHIDISIPPSQQRPIRNFQVAAGPVRPGELPATASSS